MEQEFATHRLESPGGICVVRVSGEIDIATAPRLEAVIDEVVDLRPSSVLVELDDVSFLDSSGIRTLVVAKRRLAEIDASFVIDGMSETVKHVLEIAGMLDALATPDSQ